MAATRWAAGFLMAAGLLGSGAQAKGPEPVPQDELGACVELVRERIYAVAANNETQVSSELSAPTPDGETRIKGIALATRSGPTGTELIYAAYAMSAVGVTGTFGPWPVKVTALGRGYAVLSVPAPLAEVEAQRKKDRVVWLGPAPDQYPGDAGTYPQVADAGTLMSREATVAAVEEMNKQGGLPWIAWADRQKPVYRRVKVVPFNELGVEWVPAKDPESAMHAAYVFALDLEGNGTPYLVIAYNDSPVSDMTEVWRPTKGRWKKIGQASGNLATVRKGEGHVELLFDSYLDVGILRFDLGKRSLSPQCFATDGSMVLGGEDRVVWSTMHGPDSPRTVRPGPTPVAIKTYLSEEEAHGQIKRGASVWRLAKVGDQVLGAFVVPDPKTLSKKQRPIAKRVLEIGWMPLSELE